MLFAKKSERNDKNNRKKKNKHKYQHKLRVHLRAFKRRFITWTPTFTIQYNQSVSVRIAHFKPPAKNHPSLTFNDESREYSNEWKETQHKTQYQCVHRDKMPKQKERNTKKTEPSTTNREQNVKFFFFIEVDVVLYDWWRGERERACARMTWIFFPLRHDRFSVHLNLIGICCVYTLFVSKVSFLFSYFNFFSYFFVVVRIVHFITVGVCLVGISGFYFCCCCYSVWILFMNSISFVKNGDD